MKSAAEGHRAGQEAGIKPRPQPLFSTLQPHGPHRVLPFSLLPDASCQPDIITGHSFRLLLALPGLEPRQGSRGTMTSAPWDGDVWSGWSHMPFDVHLELSVPTRSPLANPGSATALLYDPGVSHNLSTRVHTLGSPRASSRTIQGEHLAERLAANPSPFRGSSSTLKVFLSPEQGMCS